MKFTNHIAIIGCGIAGLTLACALRKFNIETVIFERNAELNEYGAGISLSKNALQIFDRLNMLENIKSNSYQPGKAVWHYRKNKFYEISTDTFTASRQNLIRVLYNEYIKLGGEIFFNHEVSNILNDGKTIEFKDLKSYVIKHLAACDGIKSNIRKISFSGTTNITYSGFNAWRFLGKNKNKNINFHLDSKSHIINYPIDDNLNQSVVAIIKNKTWHNESWKQESTVEEFLDVFKNQREYLEPIINDNQKIFKWGIFVRPFLKEIYCENMTLFGDAAHPIVPFLGQGGCMAIEDSYTFALLLNKLDMNIPMAQKIYSKLRVVRNNKIARMSLQQARLNHIENYYLASLRNIIMKKTNVISSRTNYIWEYDAHVQVERELKNYSFNKTTNI